MTSAQPDVPNVARMYDYYLGGGEHRPVDRDAAERVLAVAPQVRTAVRENRAFLERVVTFLAGEGIHQFLDIGSGLPTQRNVHQILADISPGSRVMYVDYDPLVVARSRELLADTAIGTVDCLEGDVRDLDAICDDPRTRALIDFSRPVGVLLLAVLNFVPDRDGPAAIVGWLRRHLAHGSYLALSHGARAEDSPLAEGIQGGYRQASGQAVLRSRREVLDILDGCDLRPPGLVYAAQWTADPDAALVDPGTAMTFVALAHLA